MCHIDFVTYYKLPESRRLSVDFGGSVFVIVVLPGSWFFNCGEEELSFNIVFFNVLLVVMHWHSDRHQAKYPK